MKKNAIMQSARTPSISEARRKFEGANTPDVLSLEEIMMVAYNLPCRRISPDSAEAKKLRCGRGSVIIMRQEVIIVLFKGDDTVFFEHGNFNGILAYPCRQYKGVRPGSRIYAEDGGLYVLHKKEIAKELATFFGLGNLLQKNAVEKGVIRGSITEVGKGGVQNDRRCVEAWRLLGHLSAQRLAAAKVG